MELIARIFLTLFSLLYFPFGIYLTKMSYGVLTWMAVLCLAMLSVLGIGIAWTVSL